MSWLALVLGIGVAQGAFLSVALLVGRDRRDRPNRFMVSLLRVFVADLVDEFALVMSTPDSWSRLSSLNWLVDLRIRPLIYLYVRSATDPAGSSVRAGPHWRPALAAAAGLAALWLIYPADRFGEQICGQGPVLLRGFEALCILGGLVSMGLYLWLSARRLAAAHRTASAPTLRWLRRLIHTLLALYAIWLLIVVSNAWFDVYWLETHVLYPAIVCAIFAFGWLGLLQPPQAADRPASREAKYARSGLGESEAALVFAALEAHMLSVRPHLDETLSLSTLAGQLGLSTNALSQAINETGSVSFRDYINRFRIDEAMRLLRNSDASIQTIACASGFASRGTFYEAFRRRTGITPTDFRRDRDAVPATRIDIDSTALSDPVRHDPVT